MAVPFLKNSFVTGEISSELWGRTDLQKYQTGASTMRNMYVNYRGGANSRAGTLFAGYSKQTGQPLPPRLIPFQFSVQQGLILEFGNFYMRVLSNGAYVTEAGANITGITQASPATVSFSSTSAETVTSNNNGVISSYRPVDQITIAGGTVITPAVIQVNTTEVHTAALATPGSGYAPGNAITLTGGDNTAMPSVRVLTTQVAALPTIVAAGTGGTPGTATITGTTGAGTMFQASVTIGPGGGITSVNSLTVAGSYTTNPTNPADEPVTGGDLTGAALGLVMGVGTVSITAGGSFLENPTANTLTQESTTGTGTGATFQAIFAPLTLSIVNPGSYVDFPPNPVAQASTTGTGIGATFEFTSAQAAPYTDGEWVFIDGVNGMTELNGRIFVIENVTSDSFEIFDVFGNPINTETFTPYQSGGTSAAIFTLTTPYAAEDLAFLKFTQSADVMSLACWNQDTLTEYPPNDLTRFADNDWTIANIAVGSTVQPPASMGVEGFGLFNGLGLYVTYYYVTAVDGETGEESAPIQSFAVNGFLGETNPSTFLANSDYINWDNVTGASFYNIYAETSAPLLQENPDILPPPTWIAGFIGQSNGTSFSNPGISPDFSQGPPQHQNPFANGTIVAANLVTAGNNYGDNGQSPLSTTAEVSSATGSGAIIFPIYVGVGSFPLGSLFVFDGGENYEPGDTISISGTGSGATGTLTVGPSTGNFPGSVAYFQERRVYASTQNNPDTYFFSQSGLFLNFDTHFPTVSDDAITGSPWAQLVDGIQWMINMPGGLVVLTGTSAWQLTGAGGSSLNPVAITPESQQAQPQAYNGVSPIVPPIKIDYQILYVQAKGSIVREFSYQFYTNIYTGLDLTEISSQLFEGYQISQWAYAEEPRKIIWAIRSDGAMLSLTYLKSEEVSAWARHDTQGQFVSVATCTELPVDALYVAVQRVINGQTCYTVERMDNRNWPTIEDAWCVDAGLSLAQVEPNATISASSSYGVGALTGVTNLVGGKGYSAGTFAVVTDDNGRGAGSGAVAALTIVGGVITDVAFPEQGKQYSFPAIEFVDPAGSAGGSGASATVVLNNAATFTASAGVFSAESVGDVIRMGGGIAEITAFVSPEEVTANILVPITATFPNSSVTGAAPIVIPQVAGSWTMSTPQTVIGGLFHLVGATVTGLADGNVIPPQVVAADGTITLDTPASAVTVGLGFVAQLQNVYWDAQGTISQGRRKSVVAATVRATLSRDLQIGANEPDGSALSPQQIDVFWRNMQPVPNRRLKTYNGLAAPLFTGDTRVTVGSGMDARGQLALQQSNPVPMNIDAIITEVLEGDYEAGGKGGEQPAGGGNAGSAGTGFYIEPLAA
jgi:hypothetical protein